MPEAEARRGRARSNISARSTYRNCKNLSQSPPFHKMNIPSEHSESSCRRRHRHGHTHQTKSPRWLRYQRTPLRDITNIPSAIERGRFNLRQRNQGSMDSSFLSSQERRSIAHQIILPSEDRNQLGVSEEMSSTIQDQNLLLGISEITQDPPALANGSKKFAECPLETNTSAAETNCENSVKVERVHMEIMQRTEKVGRKKKMQNSKLMSMR